MKSDSGEKSASYPRDSVSAILESTDFTIRLPLPFCGLISNAANLPLFETIGLFTTFQAAKSLIVSGLLSSFWAFRISKGKRKRKKSKKPDRFMMKISVIASKDTI